MMGDYRVSLRKVQCCAWLNDQVIHVTGCRTVFALEMDVGSHAHVSVHAFSRLIGPKPDHSNRGIRFAEATLRPAVLGPVVRLLTRLKNDVVRERRHASFHTEGKRLS